MKLMGLDARTRCKRKYSSYKGEIGKKADNLIQRQFEGAKPYEKCYTDVTEFALQTLRRKFIYPLFLMATIVKLLSLPCHAHLI